MAAGFEWADRARVRAAQAARIPAICNVFPATIEMRRKIVRCGSEFELFIFAELCRSSHSRSELASRVLFSLIQRDEDANEVCSRGTAVEHAHPSRAWTGHPPEFR